MSIVHGPPAGAVIPGLIQRARARIAGALGSADRAAVPSLSTALPVEKRATPLNLATSLMRSLDYGADGRLRNAYLQSVSVYRCVNLRADAIAQAPFALYRGQDKIESHPLLDILRNPSQQFPTSIGAQTTLIAGLVGRVQEGPSSSRLRSVLRRS